MIPAAPWNPASFPKLRRKPPKTPQKPKGLSPESPPGAERFGHTGVAFETRLASYATPNRTLAPGGPRTFFERGVYSSRVEALGFRVEGLGGRGLTLKPSKGPKIWQTQPPDRVPESHTSNRGNRGFFKSWRSSGSPRWFPFFCHFRGEVPFNTSRCHERSPPPPPPPCL